MKKLIKFICVAVLFVMACGDDDKDVVSDNEFVTEFRTPSTHAICNFYKSYHLSIDSDVTKDSVRMILSIEGRTLDEIHELIEKNQYVSVRDYDVFESNAEIEQYCNMFHDTCFNAMGFGTYTTLDTIADISIVCNSNDTKTSSNIDESAVIEYNDIKKIVGIDDFAGKYVSAKDFDWHVSKHLVDFNMQTDNYLIEMEDVVIKFPAPKKSGDYYYTLTYTCTNSKKIVLKDTVVVK